MMKVKGGEPKHSNIEDGLHEGEISKAEVRTPEGKDYSYYDITIKTVDKDGNEIELKAGYPLPKTGEAITSKMFLGQILEKFLGKKIVAGQEYDLDSIIIGSVKFQTKTKTNNEITYTEIIRDTLKPATEVE